MLEWMSLLFSFVIYQVAVAANNGNEPAIVIAPTVPKK